MATTRIIPLHAGKGRTAKQAISTIINYVENPDKTDHGQLISCYQCDARLADSQFALAKEIYQQQTGRRRGDDDVIAYHFRQAFAPGEVTREEANQIGQEFARRFTNGNHAYIVCTHVDRHHIHNHIIWNATSLDCTRKFRNFWGSTKAYRQLSDQICIEHGLSVVEKKERRGLSYNKWADGKPNRTSLRDELRAVIDQVLEQQPQDLDAFFQLLQELGYEVKTGKDISIRGGKQKRFIRLSTLGDGYSMPELLAVISGTKTHTPQPKLVVVRKVSLIIDIDQKLQEGKSGGYKQWASVFNAKQIAQTYNYLRDYNLLDRADLDSKAEKLTAEFHEMQTKMDSLDQRMSEITEMKAQIIAYNKTRAVFQEYKNSGYSKTFFTEHKAEIEQHRATKHYFNEHRLTKLPTIKSLQDEFGALLTEKKSLYGNYKTTREKMKEVLNVQSNVNQILGVDFPALRKENEHNR